MEWKKREIAKCNDLLSYGNLLPHQELGIVAYLTSLKGGRRKKNGSK